MRGTLVFLGLLLAGCSSNPSTTPDASLGDSATDAFSDASADANGRTTERLQFTSPMLAPGEERTICMLKKMSQRTARYLRSARVHIGGGSHHLIVYRSPEQEEQPWGSCGGFSGLFNAGAVSVPMVLAQQERSELRLPEDPPVGMPLREEQMLRIEFHVLNTTSNPLQAMAEVELDTVPVTPDVQRADLLFWGTSELDLAPRSMRTVHYRRSPPTGVKLFAVSSHTHQFGTLATVSLATGVDPDYRDLRELHRSTTWSEPPLSLLNPPVVLGANEHLHLACTFNNTSDGPVRFGESALDEMCFLIGYYYPGQGSSFCLQSSTGSTCGVLRE